ncbi:MAG TPA: hypothetical protein VJI32_00565 [Candidatus Nanoarchaeia archaeon]|nr:hypothetical protein [Candidatus Nanoarchaeia archaeon]
MIALEELWITKHAGDKMVVGGITSQQICEAIERGSRFTQTEGYLGVCAYFSVAWKKVDEKYKIKTVFLNK